MMLPIAIQSRMITEALFDPMAGKLMLRLANGEERLFTGVPLEAVMELVQSPSPGQHYVEKFRHQYQRAP